MEGRPDLGVILPFGRRSFRIEFLELMAGFAVLLSPLSFKFIWDIVVPE
jgi:hypothetical protein